MVTGQSDRPSWMAFGTTSPWYPPALFLPPAAALFAAGLALGVPFGRAAILFSAGLLSWTAVEYFLHRVVFHAPGIAGAEHRRHHSEPRRPDYVAAPALMALPLFFVFTGLFCLAAWSVPHGLLLSSGLSLGYVLYEQVHFRSHHGTPRTAIGRYWRKYHMIHHFKDGRNFFGVTTPFWDLVFRTKPR